MTKSPKLLNYSATNITINNSDSKGNINSIFLMSISKDEIKNYVLNNKEKNSFHIFKYIIDVIIIPLDFIFNLLLTSGIFSNIL